MANDSGGGSNAVWLALIGLATTISGGVLANWDKIFPPADPQATLMAEPAAAGPADAASEPEAEEASTPDAGASEPAH